MYKFLAILAFTGIFAVGTTSCEKDDDVNNSSINVTVNGNIDLTLDNSALVGTEVSVSFDRFPASLSEFKKVRETLKNTPQGAVALQLMAMELYHRNKSAGEAAFKECNTTSNVSVMVNRCYELFHQSSDPQYARPYQVAAFLSGATPDNGYNPTEPYTVRLKVSQNGATYSENYQAKVLQFVIFTEGSDTGSRLGPDVVNTAKPGEPTGWIVDNSPSLVSRVRAISYTSEFKGLK